MPYFQKELTLIQEKISALLIQKERIVIAIDGRCASGKTTLAKVLSEELTAPFVSCDDFFLPPEKRTKERLSEIGGNMDRERLFLEVLSPFLREEAVCFRPFICQTMSYGNTIFLPKSNLLIVEGAYSCHPDLWDCYDLHIFMTLSKEEQKRRILQRNPNNANDFFTKWIPMEEKYLEGGRVAKNAELVIEHFH